MTGASADKVSKIVLKVVQETFDNTCVYSYFALAGFFKHFSPTRELNLPPKTQLTINESK